MKFYYRINCVLLCETCTNFVLLSESFFCYSRCKKPCFLCKNILKFWVSWRICTGGKSTFGPFITKHNGRVTCVVHKMHELSHAVELCDSRKTGCFKLSIIRHRSANALIFLLTVKSTFLLIFERYSFFPQEL